MTWVLTSSGSAVSKAGLWANSSIVVSGSWLALRSDDAEGFIALHSHRDFVTNYSSLNSEVKKALSDLASSHIAKAIIVYDTSGYSSSREAELLLDKLDDDIRTGLSQLKEFKSSSVVVV